MDLQRHDLDAAARQGLIDPLQAEPLWHFLQTRLHDQRPGFRAAHILYYLGGLIAIGAMTLFMTLGWERFGGGGLMGIALVYGAGAVAATHWLLTRRQLPIPAGILGTLAVALVPLAVYGLQNLLGWWPEGEAARDYHRHIDGRWLMMELATLAAGAVMLWRFRLPFLVMPVAVTLWYVSMDLAPLMAGSPDVDWELRKWVSLYFGLLIIGLAFWVDVRSRRGPDFAFWLYIAGVAAFWGGLSWMRSDSEWSRLGYCAINLGLIAVGAALSRRVFAVFGGLGVAGYLGYLSWSVFRDSLVFPFALTLIGLAVIGAGIAWQRREQALSRRLRGWLPAALRELIEARA
jgi:hypothetical protein